MHYDVRATLLCMPFTCLYLMAGCTTNATPRYHCWLLQFRVVEACSWNMLRVISLPGCSYVSHPPTIWTVSNRLTTAGFFSFISLILNARRSLARRFFIYMFSNGFLQVVVLYCLSLSLKLFSEHLPTWLYRVNFLFATPWLASSWWCSPHRSEPLWCLQLQLSRQLSYCRRLCVWSHCLCLSFCVYLARLKLLSFSGIPSPSFALPSDSFIDTDLIVFTASYYALWIARLLSDVCVRLRSKNCFRLARP